MDERNPKLPRPPQPAPRPDNETVGYHDDEEYILPGDETPRARHAAPAARRRPPPGPHRRRFEED